MKKSLFLMGLFALFISCKGNVSQTDKPQPVNLILDTDLGPDYDDVGAMALMHALADSGQVNILATLSSNHDERVVPCIEVLNTYFNRPDIPVGAPKSEPGASLTTWHKTKWTDELPDNRSDNGIHFFPAEQRFFLSYLRDGSPVLTENDVPSSHAGNRSVPTVPTPIRE